MEDEDNSSFVESLQKTQQVEQMVDDTDTGQTVVIDPLTIQDNGIVKTETIEQIDDLVHEGDKSEEVVSSEIVAFESAHIPSADISDVLIKTEVDATANEALAANGQDCVPQQFIILTRTSDGGTVQVDNPEILASKYIRFEGTDGQTYFLAVTDEEATGITEPSKSLPSQQVVPAQAAKSGRKRSMSSTSPITVSPPTASTSVSIPSSSSSPASINSKVPNRDSINQAWFTTRDDKNALHDEGHNWKQGQWTKDEVEILRANIDKYCKDRNIKDPAEIVFEMSKDERKDFYRTIALGIQRPLFSVYRRVTRMYDRKNHRGKYSPSEMKHLRALRAKHGNDWAAIGVALGRSASSVKDKCRLMKDNCNSGKWYPEEENRLAAAVHKLTGVKPSESITSGLSWAIVAEHVGTRSEKQCRTKWLNYLNWKQQGGSDWTREDDSLLIEKVSKMNVNNDSEIDWVALSQDWTSVRSPQWLRGKWWALKRHIPEYNKLSYPDLLENMKQSLFWNLKPKNGVRPVKLERKADSDGVPAYLKNCIPVSITADQDGNAALSLSYCPPDEGEGYQFEVLQHWSPQIISQVAHNSSALEDSQAVTTTEGHIIVPTIASGLTDSIHLNTPQQVIISTGSGDDANTSSESCDQETMALQLTNSTVQSEQDLSVLNGSEKFPDANIITAMTYVPGEGEEIVTVSEYAPETDVGGDTDIMSQDVFEAVTSEAGGDLVMCVSSPTHASSHLTGLKDPILMSSSDVECDKTQGEHAELID